jgi:lipopolysaccharide transport system ATP-binding protein
MNTIRKLCDRCIVLDKGRIVFDGDVEEAIALYMDNAAKLCLVNKCDAERKRKDIDKTVHIDSISILNREEYPIFYQGEDIQMNIELSAKHSAQDITFRMTIHSADDSRAGMATTKPCIAVQEGENKVKLTLPMEWLAPGKYFVDLVAYSVNEYGHNQLHDVVESAFAFEKLISAEDNNSMVWQHSWWGYVMFPEVQVEQQNK